MAMCGRALPWIQKSESHPFAFDRTSAHSLRHSHASGGGEIVRTSACCASAERSGGISVVQETRGLSNELESKLSLIAPPEIDRTLLYSLMSAYFDVVRAVRYAEAVLFDYRRRLALNAQWLSPRGTNAQKALEDLCRLLRSVWPRNR